MRPSIVVAPLAFLLSSCAAMVNTEIGDSGLKQAETAVPADPCPQVKVAAPAFGPAEPGRLPVVSRTGDESDLEIGIQLIRASATRDAQPGDRRGFTAASRTIEKAISLNLAWFAPYSEHLDLAGAIDADKALSSPGFQQIESITAPPEPRQEQNTPLSISRSDWMDASRLTARATIEDGWMASFATALGRSTNEKAAQSFTEVSNDLTKKGLIAAYMIAYFHNGAIFELDFNQKPLEQRLTDQLKQKIADLAKRAGMSADQIAATQKEAEADLNKFLTDYEDKVCANGKTASDSCVVFGVKDEKTFVTRAGKSYGFPGITATIDPTSDKKISTNKINTDQIIVDLIRVVVEATGDSIAKVPGAKNSTLCEVSKIDNPDTPLCATDGQAKDLQQVNDAGDRVEAGTTTLVGAAIRGGWLFSLNNETLATALTAGVAVSLRKTAEGIAWKIRHVPSCRIERGAPLYRDVSFKIKE